MLIAQQNGLLMFLLVVFYIFIRVTSSASRHRHPQQNLLDNGDFDYTDKQTGFVGSWTCQGEQANSPLVPMLRTMRSSKTPPFAGLCTERLGSRYGPSIDIRDFVEGDGLYKVQGWTKLTNGKTKEEYESIEMWLRWKRKGRTSHEEMKMLAARGKFLKNNGWVFWNAQFHLFDYPAFDYVTLYFKGPPSHVDILIDDVFLTPIPRLLNWREYFGDRIEDVRKRDVLLRVEFEKSEFDEKELGSRAKLQVSQISSDFGWGVSVHYDAIKLNPRYRSFIQSNFEWATMEHRLKWPFIEKRQNEIDYSKTDEMINWIQNEMRMKIRGHCIFWAVENEQPKWLLTSSSTQLKFALRQRLHGVLNRYKDRITDWDVNNEMLHGSFYSDATNETIRDWMFYEAHKIFPHGRMFVNEFEVLSAPWFTQSYVEQIRQFQKKGIQIDGIGVQGHFAGHVHPEILKERLDILSVLGLPIWITELDAVVENDVKRAEVIEKILRVAYAHPAVEGVVMWTFWDKHEWKKNASLFHGHNFKPNEAGEKYLNIRQEWKTELSNIQPDEVTPQSCIFRFRAFHGVHRIKVNLPDGSVLEQNVVISNNPGELVLVFNKQKSDDETEPD